ADTTAKLRRPRAVAVALDHANIPHRLLIADSLKHSIVVFDMDGNYIHHWGGTGDDDGQFHFPMDMEIHEGKLYVVEYHRIQVFRVIDGAFIHKWGARGSGDGEFDQAYGITISGGRVFVVDSWSHRIQVFDLDGKFIRKWGRQGSDSGLYYPVNIA